MSQHPQRNNSNHDVPPLPSSNARLRTLKRRHAELKRRTDALYDAWDALCEQRDALDTQEDVLVMLLDDHDRELAELARSVANNPEPRRKKKKEATATKAEPAQNIRSISAQLQAGPSVPSTSSTEVQSRRSPSVEFVGLRMTFGPGTEMIVGSLPSSSNTSTSPPSSSHKRPRVKNTVRLALVRWLILILYHTTQD